MSDGALKRWQLECDGSGRPFAVLRVEAQRASLWFILAGGREWTAREKMLARDSLANATGVVLTNNSAQAFVKRDSEAPVMEQLLRTVTSSFTQASAAGKVEKLSPRETPEPYRRRAGGARHE
jgi:hypothetical protein